MQSSSVWRKPAVAAALAAVLVVAASPMARAQSSSFWPTGSMVSGRSYHTATVLADGTVLVAGGSSGSGSLASAEIYDPKSGTFSPTGSMAVSRYFHTATVLADGTVLVAGGYSRSWARCQRGNLQPEKRYFLTHRLDGVRTLLPHGHGAR